MNIAVMSRKEAEAYCTQKHDISSAIISISTPNDSRANLEMTQENNVIDILRLSFFDVDTDTKEYYSFNRLDAYKISQFVEKHAKLLHTHTMIVHCDAGRSRSAGVAAAIMKYLHNNDTPIFNNSMYNPNRLCYRLTLDGLCKYMLDIREALDSISMDNLDKANLIIRYILDIKNTQSIRYKRYIKTCVKLYDELMQDYCRNLEELRQLTIDIDEYNYEDDFLTD